MSGYTAGTGLVFEVEIVHPTGHNIGHMSDGCDRCANLEERISELEELLLSARGDVTDLEARVVSEEAMHRLEVERMTGGVRSDGVRHLAGGM